MIYFDACYIAKFYLAEPDSPSVITFAKANANIGCLLIGKAEVIAVFHRKLRESVVDVSGFHLLCDQFDADCASGLWQWRAVDDALMASSARRFRGLPSTTFLRAADGLHIEALGHLETQPEDSRARDREIQRGRDDRAILAERLPGDGRETVETVLQFLAVLDAPFVDGTAGGESAPFEFGEGRIERGVVGAAAARQPVVVVGTPSPVVDAGLDARRAPGGGRRNT